MEKGKKQINKQTNKGIESSQCITRERIPNHIYSRKLTKKIKEAPERRREFLQKMGLTKGEFLDVLDTV